MRNIKLTIEYDGSRYQGWQRLGKDEATNTITNKITEVIKKMTNEDIELFCGARTEVGVHAYGQVASFKTTTDMTLIEIQHYLNRYLPMDIAITDIEEKPERFHASQNATSKIPDVDLMKQAAMLLVGKHDFKKFSTVKKNKSTVKEIYDIDVYDDGEELQITLHGNDFLHNMARMILGTLLDIGVGNRKKEDIELIFDSNSDVAASAPADPKGLYLQEVLYQ